MAFDSGTAKDVFYQYFWVKIANDQQVAAQRKGQLLKGPDSNGFFFPMISDVVPAAKPSRALMVAGKKANVHVGFEIDPVEAAGKGLMLDLRMATPGYTLPEARKWIGTTAGIQWAGGALCVLCFVAIEPLKAGVPAAKKVQKKAPAKKRAASSRKKTASRRGK